MSIKAIAFDFDHTLYDRNVTFANLAWQFRRTFDIKPEVRAAELLCALIRADETSIINETDWQGMLDLLTEWGIFATAPTFEAFYAFFLEHFPPAIRLYPQTEDVLKWCQASGYITAIITNGKPPFQHRKMAACGIDKLIAHRLVAIETGKNKPDPLPFLHMANTLSIQPNEMIYVGDNPVNDIQGALNAGLHAVWLTAVGWWPEGTPPPKYTIQSLDELPSAVQKITAAR